MAAWMKDLKIANHQKDLDTEPTVYCNHKLSSNRSNYQNTRKKLKNTYQIDYS